MYNLLGDSGKIVGITDCAFKEEDIPFMKKYEIEYEPLVKPLKRVDGEKVIVRIGSAGNEVVFQSHYWTRESISKAFELTGFKNFEWHPLTLKDGEDPEFWSDYFKHPANEAFSALKMA